MSDQQPPEEPPRYDTPYGANPYGGPRSAAEPLAGLPPLAPLGRRLLARIIDALVVGVPMALLIIAAGGHDSPRGGTYLQQSLALLVYFAYDGLMLTSRGQTLGKMAMRIRVARVEGGEIPRGGAGWARAAVYALPQLVPCVGFLFWLLNVLYCTWDQPLRQCLHDKAARTVVVSAES